MNLNCRAKRDLLKEDIAKTIFSYHYRKDWFSQYLKLIVSGDTLIGSSKTKKYFKKGHDPRDILIIIIILILLCWRLLESAQSH